MSAEDTFFAATWDIVSAHVRASDRSEVAISLMRAFEDFGVEHYAFRATADEDQYVKSAYDALYDEPPLFDDYGDDD